MQRRGRMRIASLVLALLLTAAAASPARAAGHLRAIAQRVVARLRGGPSPARLGSAGPASRRVPGTAVIANAGGAIHLEAGRYENITMHAAPAYDHVWESGRVNGPGFATALAALRVGGRVEILTRGDFGRFLARDEMEATLHDVERLLKEKGLEGRYRATLRLVDTFGGRMAQVEIERTR